MELLAIAVVFLSFNLAQASDLDKGMLSFTFDDGWATDYDNVYPILKNKNMVATTYIIPLYVGEDYDGRIWDRVTWDNIWELHNNGWEIGNHTYNHYDLTSLPDQGVIDELEMTQEELIYHGVLGSGALAFPYGAYDQRTLDLIANTKFITSARQAWTEYNEQTDVWENFNEVGTFDRWRLRVVNIANVPVPEDTEYLMDLAATDKKWLIFVIHRVVSYDPIYETEYALNLFERLANYAKNLRDNGQLDIVTINQGVSRMLYYQSK